MPLGDLLATDAILPALKVNSKKQAIQELAAKAAELTGLSERDVFDTLPGEGRWSTALLADGNVGIGGDPVALLRRLCDVLSPVGRVVAELASPGTRRGTGWATVRAGDTTSAPIPWAVVGVDDVDALAAASGLVVGDVRRIGERWCAVLEAA